MFEITGELNWLVVLGAAAVDSINPCAIGVLILLISTLIVMHNDRKKMLAVPQDSYNLQLQLAGLLIDHLASDNSHQDG